MVSFSHLDAGTSEDVWASAAPWSALPPLVLNDVSHLIVLSAHPDDETLGAAGLIARVAERGARVTVVVASDGESSHPHSPSHTPAELAAVRRNELAQAVRALAPDAAVHFLELPDGELREHRDELGLRLEAIVCGGPAAASWSAETGTVLAGPWRGDGHRDHRVAGEAADAVARRCGLRMLEYPIWAWHWSEPGQDTIPWPRMARLDLTPGEHSAKERAMAVHRSQTHPLSERQGDEAMLSAEMQRHFSRMLEVFVDTPAAQFESEAVPSLAEEFFDRFYAGKSDPWGFESRWYEQRKRAITLACLPRPRFASGLEVGCSTGVLTAVLAERCDRLLAVDIADAPLERARARLRESTGVRVEKMTAPREWPEDSFDLIVLSEVGYYWSEADLDDVIDKAVASLRDDGILLACHWRHSVAEYPLDGDRVHARIRRRPDLRCLARHLEEDFVLEVFAPPPAFSVARATGVI